MKAKLVDGHLIYAPKNIVYNNTKYVGNVPDDILTNLGYKDVVRTSPPQPEEGYHLVNHWQELEDQIVLTWESVKNSPADEVAALKQKLFESDYQAIKYAEGWISAEDYAPMKAQRQEWRTRINELENDMK